MRSSLAAVVLLLALLTAPVPAGASQLLARDVSNVTLAVDASGRALVTYQKADGKLVRALAWGAIDAAAPVPGSVPTTFQTDYSGGWKTFRVRVWKTFANACGPYAGPALAFAVAACTAPDGSHWALQEWIRSLPYHGAAPTSPFHGTRELRLSHWSGDTAVLEVWHDWKFGGVVHELFGRLTYRGVGVHALAGAPGFARRMYFDSFDSGYGPGWQRADALLTHAPAGTFCAVFAHRLEDKYGINRGWGSHYRATVEGPGVTPDLSVEVAALPAYDPANPQLVEHERAMNALWKSLGDRDRRCRPD